MTQGPTLERVQDKCPGTLAKCPYPVTVAVDANHPDATRCGCNARSDLEDMAFSLATGLGGVVEPSEFKATLDRYAAQVLIAHADRLDNLPPGGEALKGPYWYRQGIKDGGDLARDKADQYRNEAHQKTKQTRQD